jgi:hypothetical protein
MRKLNSTQIVQVVGICKDTLRRWQKLADPLPCHQKTKSSHRRYDLSEVLDWYNKRLPDPLTKLCRACGVIKSTDDFSNSSSKKDGKQYQCKACNKTYAAAYYASPEGNAITKACHKRNNSTPEGKAAAAKRSRLYYLRKKLQTVER